MVSLTLFAIAGLIQTKPAAKKMKLELLTNLARMEENLDEQRKVAILQGLKEAVDESEQEVAAQFFRFLARHTGRRLCRRLYARPYVVMQNIDYWLENEAKVMHHEESAETQRLFRRFFRRHGRRLFRIGRRVCNIARFG